MTDPTVDRIVEKLYGDDEPAPELPIAERIRINITDGEGILLGTIEMSRNDLKNARWSPIARQALVDEIASEAGVR